MAQFFVVNAPNLFLELSRQLKRSSVRTSAVFGGFKQDMKITSCKGCGELTLSVLNGDLFSLNQLGIGSDMIVLWWPWGLVPNLPWDFCLLWLTMMKDNTMPPKMNLFGL